MSKARILRGLVLLASLALALMVSAPRRSPVAQAALPGDSGQFAIDSNRDGNEEIYVTNADGSGKTLGRIGNLSIPSPWSSTSNPAPTRAQRT